jgi:hypothetical protein
MKTMKFRLLATIMILAAVITATPINAQRRSSTNSANENKTETTRTANKSNIEKKGTFREVAREPQAAKHSVNSSHNVNRHNTTAVKETIREGVRIATRTEGTKSNRENHQFAENNTSKNRNEKVYIKDVWENSEVKDRKNNSDKEMANATVMPNRSTDYSSGNTRRNDNGKAVYNSSRATSASTSERYNLNPNDTRYKPNENYHGSNKYWTSDYRAENRNNIHYNGNHNYNNYNYWDRSWEGYCWNQSSWMNYYNYYNPYDYRNYKYYYHHPYYGHVIRKFNFQPQVFIHNHNRYYCFDGHFFRYHHRVGYVLVDIPFGMSFEYIPDEYERVYINGFLYFRVGNLFFENTNYGFQLVHYPERYYAYNEDYCNEGFHFND